MSSEHTPAKAPVVGKHPDLSFVVIVGNVSEIAEGLAASGLEVLESISADMRYPLDTETGEWTGKAIGYRPESGNRDADSKLGVFGHGNKCHLQASLTFTGTKNKRVMDAYAESKASRKGTSKTPVAEVVNAFA